MRLSLQLKFHENKTIIAQPDRGSRNFNLSKIIISWPKLTRPKTVIVVVVTLQSCRGRGTPSSSIKPCQHWTTIIVLLFFITAWWDRLERYIAKMPNCECNRSSGRTTHVFSSSPAESESGQTMEWPWLIFSNLPRRGRRTLVDVIGPSLCPRRRGRPWGM